jgi:hypothetical protein
MQFEQRARHRASDHGRKRHRRHEQRDDACPLPRREPIGEIEDDAGEEARFGDAQQKAHHVETGLAIDKSHGGGDEPPADHDARDPDGRAESLERQIARDLEQDIADEKDAGAGPEHRGRETEVLVHGERGEPDIHPIEEIHRIAEAKKRDETARGLGNGRLPRLVLIHPLPPMTSTTKRRDSAHQRKARDPHWSILWPVNHLIRSSSGRTLKWR